MNHRCKCRPVLVALFTCLACVVAGAGEPLTTQPVGDSHDETVLAATSQLIHPAGQTLVYPGRPLDLVLCPGKPLAFVKNAGGLGLLDTANWKIVAELKEIGSMHGLAVTVDPSGIQHVFYTNSHHSLLEAIYGEGSELRWGKSIALPGPSAGGQSDSIPLGVALSADGSRAFVCLSKNNTLAVVDLKAGTVISQIPVGICPYGVVLSADQLTAYVTNFGGHRAGPGATTLPSSGSAVIVDSRGIPSSGTVSVIDLHSGKEVSEIEVGLHPCQAVISRDGKYLYVANANSDSVSIVALAEAKVLRTISVRPDANLPIGTIPNALALSHDEKTLYCACGGNNAIAVISLGESSHVLGYIPAGWFPGAVACDGNTLYVANVKGIGSRNLDPKKNAWNTRHYMGSLTRVTIPEADALAAYTVRVKEDGRLPLALKAFEKGSDERAATPVPKHLGEASLIHHVIYVIKENRTFDQVLGDIGRGNADPRLCIYGANVTPNQHALANQFVLLDNYFCNGVISADGHGWATQGMVSDYNEKEFGGHPRSYDFGSDALCYASCDFLWDTVLMHGLSFRNYGEFDSPQLTKHSQSWFDVYADWKATGSVSFRQVIEHTPLKPYTSPDYPGWNLKITDQFRMDVFLREFKTFEASKTLAHLTLVYLPQDHTSGTKTSFPSPRADVADNDLAVGRLVDAVSHSSFWASTAIFINEDDPQDGFDHVDGHRSTCQVISPYVRHGQVISHFYNQTAVLHTICNIFGLPPMNQMVALSPTMEECFTSTADLAPYNVVHNLVPLDEPNNSVKAMSDEQLKLSNAMANADFSNPDKFNDDVFNRILWYAERPKEPYPREFAGPHGRGLAKLSLKLEKKPRDDDD